MNKRRRLLILYDWFYPGFRAGGPIQSLTNLVPALEKEFDVHILTTASDYNSNTEYHGILVNSWNKIQVPNSNEATSVFYARAGSLNGKVFKDLVEEIKPATVYFNGIFSYRFFLLPLLSLKRSGGNSKIVICPRGMLNKGALAGKPLKKKIYLAFLRLLGLVQTVHWHATSLEEANNIRFHFPRNKGIVTALNIPKVPFSNFSSIYKNTEELKLVSLSLISEHKNILLLLELLATFSKNIELDIYGPVTDHVYWKKCESLMTTGAVKIRYMGDIEPANVQEALLQYHALILLTKGENFGHSIYESLSVGRPVITSHFTPWNDLKARNGGVNVDITSREDCLQALNVFYRMKQEEFNGYCAGAHAIAVEYFKGMDTYHPYRQLFL